MRSAATACTSRSRRMIRSSPCTSTSCWSSGEKSTWSPTLTCRHVGADAARLAPHQPLGHLGGRGDQDAAAGAPVAVLLAQRHQQAVVQHLDRQPAGDGVVLGHVDNATRASSDHRKHRAFGTESRGSAPAELVEALLLDAEVVRDLVDDGDRDLVDDLVLGLADVADRLAVDHDPVGQRAAVVASRARSARSPRRARAGPARRGCGPRPGRRRCPAAPSARPAPRRGRRRQLLELRAAGRGFTSWSAAGGPPRSRPRSAPPAPRARAAPRPSARRRRCTTSGRRPRSRRSGPRRPGRAGSRYIRDDEMPSSNRPARARSKPDCGRRPRLDRARRRHAERLLVEPAAVVVHVAGALVGAGEPGADHHVRRARGQRQRDVARVPHPAVGPHLLAELAGRRPRTPRPRRTAAGRRRSSSGWCTWRRGRRRP